MNTTNESQSFDRARNETISYHKLYYSQHALFEEDSWLAKPDAGLMKLVEEHLIAPAAGRASGGHDSKSEDGDQLQILDLGCGVGRNAVPMAIALTKFNVPAKITCVDVLGESIDILKSNSTTYGVAHIIDGLVADNDEYSIAPGQFDLIAAISVVEHCAGKTRVLRLLKSIARGLKPGGLARIEITTDRNVIDLGSKQPVPTHVETPLTERQVRSMLDQAFKDFEVLSLDVFPYKEVLDKDKKKILWQSKQVSFSARAG